jgi:hypothetical protein
MGNETTPVRLALSHDQYQRAQNEQVSRLNALTQRPQLWELPDKPLSKTALAPRAYVMHLRIKRLLDIDPQGIPNATDSSGTIWHMNYSTEDEIGTGVNLINITGFDGLNKGSTIYIDNPLRGDVADVVLFFSDRRRPFSATETENAMLVAEKYFDAMIGPWEEAYGLPLLTETSNDQNLNAILEILAALGLDSNPVPITPEQS